MNKADTAIDSLLISLAREQGSSDSARKSWSDFQEGLRKQELEEELQSMKPVSQEVIR